MRLLNICRELKIAVPEEIAILGRSNDPVICETMRPTLSSMDLDARQVGYVAAGMLDRMMAGEKTNELILVPPSHVEVRQSTDLMVIEDADVVQAMQYIRDYACTNIDVPRVAEEVGLVASGAGTAVSAISGPESEGGDHANSHRDGEDAPCANGPKPGKHRPPMRFRFAHVFFHGVPSVGRHETPSISQDAASLPRYAPLTWRVIRFPIQCCAARSEEKPVFPKGKLSGQAQF